jgi:hypothetical protein
VTVRHAATPERIPLVAGALVVPIIWLPILLLWGDAPFTVTFDDAWYYFEIGRNLADGHGSTFDTVNDTNGYHPLWMAVSTLVYSVGLDDMAAVRTLLAIQLAAWTGTLLILAHVAERAIAGFPRLAERPDGDDARRRAAFTVGATIALLGANPYVIKTVVNGLESGLVVLTQAALLATIWGRDGRVLGGSARERWGLGALLGFCFLARTDVIVLFGTLALWSLAEAWRLRPAAVRARAKIADLTGASTPTGADQTGLATGALARRLAEVFLLPALTAAAWMALNASVFGDPRQVSGELKRLPTTGGRLVAMLVVVAVAAVLFWRAQRRLTGPAGRSRPSRTPRVGAFFARTGWFPAFCILIVGYYQVLSAQQWLWYYAPVVLYLLFLAALVAADFCEGAVLEAPEGRAAGRAMLPIQAILLGVLGIAFGVQVVQFVDPNQRSIQLANREAGEWITANLPAEAVLGSWDAGVLGYFTEQPVMNLDGVVNSFEWLDALRAGTTDEFLRARGLTHTVNHAPMVDGEDPDIARNIDRLLGEGTGTGAVQVARFEFTYSGRIEGESGSGARPWAVFLYALPAPRPERYGTRLQEGWPDDCDPNAPGMQGRCFADP